MYSVISNWSQTDMILPKCLLFYIIFSVMPGEIFGHLGHMGTSTVSKMVLYRRRWYHILAFIKTNTIALGVQSFAAGANMICLTYTRDWWSVIVPVIHGESKSQATREQLGPCGSNSHFVNNRHRFKPQGASYIGSFGQTDGRNNFELGIPKSWGASSIRRASYIREVTVNKHWLEMVT